MVKRGVVHLLCGQQNGPCLTSCSNLVVLIEVFWILKKIRKQSSSSSRRLGPDLEAIFVKPFTVKQVLLNNVPMPLLTDRYASEY